MNLVEEYKNQYQWREWHKVYDLLPNLMGQTVLDLGCGVGDQSADFIKRKAHVIGVDLNDDLLNEARSRCPKNARFIKSDFRNLPDLKETIDGLWASFSLAYLIDLASVFASWKKHIKKGGWIAVTEIDDFFGHEPLSNSVKTILEDYAQDSYQKGRYDFYMGRKLEDHLIKSGFNISKTFTLDDEEFSFSGLASKGVVDAWQKRFDRMVLLPKFCGSSFEEVKNEFLSCLKKDEHRSVCKVFCCIGIS